MSTLSSANVTDVNLVLKERSHMRLCLNMLIFTNNLGNWLMILSVFQSSSLFSRWNERPGMEMTHLLWRHYRASQLRAVAGGMLGDTRDAERLSETINSVVGCARQVHKSVGTEDRLKTTSCELSWLHVQNLAQLFFTFQVGWFGLMDAAFCCTIHSSDQLCELSRCLCTDALLCLGQLHASRSVTTHVEIGSLHTRRSLSWQYAFRYSLLCLVFDVADASLFLMTVS